MPILPIDFSSAVRLEVRGLWAELRKQHITVNESITDNELIVKIVSFGSALAMQRSILFQSGEWGSDEGEGKKGERSVCIV
jgi:hypothetical protein